MFIKEITLSGFKSYKERTTIEGLSDGFNVIVGRNGSGKSNIFAAIHFALTFEHRVKQDVRDSFRSHGLAPQDICYVEIVFDNTERKLPIEENTVKFRRVLGTKKDRFYVSGKEIQIANAKQFLDIAGFTNPYFIVKQGKVHDLALASDSARLKIIADVTGTSVYDEKITDSRRCLEGAEANRQEIETVLLDLKERKDALETEVSDQRNFLKLDQSKRALEYVIHEKKLNEAQSTLEDLEIKRKESSDLQDPLRMKIERICRDLQINKRSLGEIEERIKHLQEIKTDYEGAANEIGINLESQRQDLLDRRNRSEITDNSILELEKKILKTKKLQERTEKELTTLKRNLQKLCHEKCQQDARRKGIQEKEFGKNQFKSAAEYHKHVEDTMVDMEQQIKENQNLLKTLIDTDNTAKENQITEGEHFQMLENNLATCMDELRVTKQKLDDLRMTECTTKAELEIVYRELNEVDQKLIQKRNETLRMKEECKKCLGPGILEGWMGVKAIIQDFRMAGMHADVTKGYYGLLCENISADPQLDLAIEAAGGKKLAHHVVQSMEIAEIILAEFNKRSCRGEVNFIPLAGVKERNGNVPVGLRGAKPLMDMIKFDPKFERVVRFVFGSTLLCMDLKTATEMMRQHKISCVTVEGENISKAGAITGGYQQSRPQKLEVLRAKTVGEEKIAKYSDVKGALDMKCKKLRDDYKITKDCLENLWNQKAKLEAKRQLLISEMETSEKKLATLKHQIRISERKMFDLNLSSASLQERKRSLKDDSENSGEMEERFKKWEAICSQYSKSEKECNNKQLELTDIETNMQNLNKEYYKRLEMSSQNEKEANKNEIARLSEVIQSLAEQISEAQAKISKAGDEISVLQKSASLKRKEVVELSEKETALRGQLLTHCGNLESFATDYAHWQSKLKELKEASANLGSVPMHLEKYEQLSDRELYSNLKKVNQKLKECSKVGLNQKALQQFEEITECCNQFEERMKRYISEKDDLLSLIRDLETKKGDAMLKNIRVLQEQFRNIFSKIVPQGTAELVLYREDIAVDRERNIDCDDLREMAGQNQFQGVKVVVNFIGKKLHKMRSLVQLSGGQKSVIALCLILAIQTIDPVPLYIFDEVDQALDAAYRESVAAVISEMAERSQFICTTFRKEFVDVAEKVFGVSYRQRHSCVQQITDTQALDFVESDISSMESPPVSLAANNEV